MTRPGDAHAAPCWLHWRLFAALMSPAMTEAYVETIATVIHAAAILSGGAYTAIRAQSHNHAIQTLKEAQWGPAPPMVPAGAQIAVLSGDPSKAAPYSVRLRFPANYAIPAHSHPTDENVVVTAG